MITSFLPFLCSFWKTGITYKDVVTFFTSLSVQVTRNRVETNLVQKDFLDYFIKLKSKKSLDDRTMAAHFMSIFWNGYETSSFAISFVIYELSKNQRVQDKLRAEILEVKDLNYESLSEMPYLEKCVYEALRLNPPLAIISKICTEATNIIDRDGNALKIEVGDILNLPVYSIHRDRDHYTNPEMFYPERFDEEDLKSCMDRCVLLVFGAGPRSCVGKKFAILQIKLFIVNIIKSFTLCLDNQTEPLTMRPDHFINSPKNPIFINFRRI